ncbi:hypothetical protein ACULML_17745 [Xanthomonas arboricola pv. corylina]|uniref:hypothetical protein n=1 Tax=Xanthomonas arboricola TaxID=56448 RepID=UPI004040904E
MQWITIIGAICGSLVTLLVALAINKPKICLRVAEYFTTISFGGAAAAVFGLTGMVAARALVLSEINANYKALSAGGVAAVDSVRQSIDSAAGNWLGIAALNVAVCIVFIGAARLSKMILDDQSEGEARHADSDRDAK